MNRRGFLGSLSTIAGALTLDPERLLWVPGKKSIFLPQLRKPIAWYRYELPAWEIEADLGVVIDRTARSYDFVNRHGLIIETVYCYDSDFGYLA